MKLKILGTEYEVIETDIETLRREAELQQDNGFFYGAVHFPTQRIFLNQALTLHILKKTLRHELAHAFLFEVGINVEAITEETVCDFVGAFGEEIYKLQNLYFTSKEPTITPTNDYPDLSVPTEPYNPYKNSPYNPFDTKIYCEGE